MAQQQPGLFDTRSQEQVLNDKWREQHAQRIGQVNEMYQNPAENTAARMGAELAGAIGRKYAPPTLTPDEQRQVEAVDAIKKRTEEFRFNNPNHTVEDLGMETQKYMAEELLRRGDMRGVQFAQSYVQQMQARQRAEMENAKLGVDTELGKAALEGQKFENVLNTVRQVYPAGSTHTSQGMAAWIQKDGSAMVIDPTTGKPRTFKVGEYSWVAPHADPNKPLRPQDLHKLIPPSQRSNMINQLAGIKRQADTYLEMHKTMQESVTESGSVNFLDKAGRIQKGYTSWAGLAASAARVAGSIFSVDGRGDMSRQDEAARYVAENPELVEKYKAYMPPEVAANSEWASRWISQATQLAYARGMTIEPNARGISDADFERHLESVVASTESPETFRRVAVANFTQDIDNFYTTIVGYGGREVQELIVGKEAWQRAADSINQFYSVFQDQGDWGSGGAPGTALTNPEVGADWDPVSNVRGSINNTNNAMQQQGNRPPTFNAFPDSQSDEDVINSIIGPP